MEIQLQVLELCLLADVPILNFGACNRFYEYRYEPHAHAQELLALNILFTCHTYRNEGWKIFWQGNRFMYSSLTCLRDATDKFGSPSSTMMTMRHLSLRLKESDHASLFKDVNLILEVCHIFKALETLHIHLEDCKKTFFRNLSQPYTIGLVDQINEARLLYRWRTKGTSCVSVHGSIRWTRYTALSNFPAGSLPRLQPKRFVELIVEILFTGLPDDAWKLEPLLVRLLSTMLSPQGRVGVGRGPRGIQYYLLRTYYGYKGFDLMTQKPEIEWIDAGDIESWIRENGYLNKRFMHHDWMVKLFSQVAIDDPFSGAGLESFLVDAIASYLWRRE